MVLVAAGQISSTASLSHNLTQVVKLINKAVTLQAKVLFLPEASDYIARNAQHSIAISKPMKTSVFVTGIQKKLKELNQQGKSLDVVVGIHEPNWKVSDNNEATKKRVKNLLIYINDKGEITQQYQKLHLFDISIPNGPILKESQSVEPGSSLTPPFDTPIGKLGLGICYDIRFPEMAVKLRDLGAQILCYPSAFTVKTGAAHWEALGRARAIDSQSYVIMAAQKGVHNVNIEDDDDGKPTSAENKEQLSGSTRISYGHAMIIDPWGSVVAQAGDVIINNNEPDIIVADIDLDVVKKVRDNMPLKEHRRRDVFNN